MKTNLRRALCHRPVAQYNAITATIEKFEARISGRKGAKTARERFYNALEKLYIKPPAPFYPTSHAVRLAAWRRQSAVNLTALAGQHTDEHSKYSRGDHLEVIGIDYVPGYLATNAPYCDMGGEGLGLVDVKRTRRYAKSWKQGPSSATTRFLVGRNEAGSYFSHPVASGCASVLAALEWIWGGRAGHIIRRQGDIALVMGSGPRMPSRLPRGHQVVGDRIVHATHPDLPLPGKGQRIIVARRAAERASKATRD